MDIPKTALAAAKLLKGDVVATALEEAKSVGAMLRGASTRMLEDASPAGKLATAELSNSSSSALLEKGTRGSRRVESGVTARYTPPEQDEIARFVSTKTNFKLLGKMERGTNGAWMVESTDGSEHIFKHVSRANVTRQVQRSAMSAAAVDSLAIRTPTFEHVQFNKGFGSWYVQELLSGKPAPNPNDKLIADMIKLNERQTGRAVDTGNNWSATLRDNLFRDRREWQTSVAKSGPPGEELVRNVHSFIGQPRELRLPNGDIVHGDFQHYNALVNRRGRLSGYLDWEGAGRGDRAFDLSRLLYDAYVSESEIGFKANPETLRMLSERIEETSGKQALNTYMSYWILQVADFGANSVPDKLPKFIDVGNRILRELGNAAPIRKLV